MSKGVVVPDLARVQCGFCLQEGALKAPTILPCSHIHCLPCLKDGLDVNHIIRCPLCRQVFDVDLDSLPSARQVVESPILCDVCTKKKAKSAQPAQIYCTVCSKLYCVAHQKDHDKQHKEHSRMNIDVYRLQASQLEKRMCVKHEKLAYNMGCKACLKVMCEKCASKKSDKCTDGSAHQILPLAELIKELRAIDEVHQREDKLSSLFKQLSQVTSDFDTDTNSLLTLLHKQRDEQLDEIRIKYEKLEKELLERRGKIQSDMVEFMEEDVGAKWSDLNVSRMKMEARLKQNHQVDIVTGYSKMKEEIQTLLSTTMARLELPYMTTLEIKDEKRDVEIDIVSSGIGRIGLDHGLEISAPPKSIKFLSSVDVTQPCITVYHYNGVTYAGLQNNAGVNRIDENDKIAKSFLHLREHVRGVTVYKDRIYTLVYNEGLSTVKVHQLTGELITSWSHADTTTRFGNKMAVIHDQLIIPDRKNKKLTFYSLTGEIIKSLPCALLNDTATGICVVNDSSVVITDYASSQVFQVDIATGDVLWISNDVPYPLGVTCLKNDYVLATTQRARTTIWIFEAKTGKLLWQITDPVVRGNSTVLDLHIHGDTLVVPRHGELKVLFYQLS